MKRRRREPTDMGGVKNIFEVIRGREEDMKKQLQQALEYIVKESEHYEGMVLVAIDKDGQPIIHTVGVNVFEAVGLMELGKQIILSEEPDTP
ncbi:hypothetical protein [Polycladomyces abyssicola]|uniref:hypothetical protein n=1 Tax=Polycladomyces abyssicola TaxID=1125966 RepID=UPI001BB2DB52|nr:hypothetical protein [Polycladomyces abyssicola]